MLNAFADSDVYMQVRTKALYYLAYNYAAAFCIENVISLLYFFGKFGLR